MSNPQDFLQSRRSGEVPENSNFAKTCNLLSEYLKEKVSLSDISLELAGKLEAKGTPETSRLTTTTTTTTMNLLPNMEKSTSQHVKTLDFFPQYAEVGSSSTTEDADAINKPTSSKPAAMEPKTAQMTMFYAGQVLVFDDFPVDKAREIMLLASKESSPNSTGLVSTSSVASGLSTLPNFGSSPAEERLQPQPQAINSHLPLATRASLHRFFQKRKDRVTARAPYQLHNPSTASPKHEEQL